MTLIIAVPKEVVEGERRVAASPETVKKLVALGCLVRVEEGAGEGASFPDAMFRDAGAEIVRADSLYKGAGIVLKVQGPGDAELGRMDKGTLLIGLLDPHRQAPARYAGAGIDAFSMELVPRITRAQAMDVLSSQSNLAGYKSVLDAAEHFSRAFPMMMTAAGTIPPAKVFIMGAGVAGLQAIATARRLGAVVSATDVRPAAKEQVQSLGASFVAVEDEEFKQAETAGGYAKQMSAEYQKKQQALVEETIKKQDIVITTALIPGRKAPVLVTAEMVRSMKPGAVIVDLAVEQGGNCELSKPGVVENVGGVKIVGNLNVPSRLATDASALYAKNLLNLLTLIIDKEKKALAINYEDDIIKGVALTRGGVVVHPAFGGVSGAASKPEGGAAAEEGAKRAEASESAPASAPAPKADEPAAKTRKKTK